MLFLIQLLRQQKLHCFYWNKIQKLPPGSVIKHQEKSLINYAVSVPVY